MNGGYEPSVGDFSLCITCGCPVRFSENMTLIRVSMNDAKRLLSRDNYRKFKLARALILSRCN